MQSIYYFSILYRTCKILGMETPESNFSDTAVLLKGVVEGALLPLLWPRYDWYKQAILYIYFISWCNHHMEMSNALFI